METQHRDRDRDRDRESKLINQGTYGCIYYPSLPFQLQRNKKTKVNRESNDHIRERTKYVSKLQKHNFHSEFEDYIGRKIQEIPSYELFFVPILKTYNIDLATIKPTYITECDAVSKYIKRKQDDKTIIELSSKDYQQLNKKFIIQKMKFIKGISLHDYIVESIKNTHRNHKDYDYYSEQRNNHSVAVTLRKEEEQAARYMEELKDTENDSYYLMSILFDLYERINDSIQLLVKYHLVHYDIKENNILVETRQQLPYIIDFGLSIDVSRLLSHPWNENEERNNSANSSREIDSNVLYNTNSSKIFKHNYLWRQHFYIHAPDYFLWPMEVHIITYFVNEDEILTDNDLHRICYEYVVNNRALAYMSPKFKENIYHAAVATYQRFVHQPREKVLNELLNYWDKWDVYAVNIMFIRIMYNLIFHIDKTQGTDAATDAATDDESSADDAVFYSHSERRQSILDPDFIDKNIRFHTKYKLTPKHKYNNRKIMNTLQVMLRNIHPNPDKRMTPQETKAFFKSIFYE